MIFATDELVNHRKEKAKRIQSEIKTKLVKVQKLVISRILKGKNIVFEISSYSGTAMIHSIDGIECGHKYYEVRLTHFDHMDYDYDDCICEFYIKQLEIVNYWLKILK